MACGGRSERAAGVEAVIQLHRLREVMALAGFTRFEAVTPDIHGEYETDVERAAIAAGAELVSCRREPGRRACSCDCARRRSKRLAGSAGGSPAGSTATGQGPPRSWAETPQVGTRVPRRTVCVAAHALAPFDPVARHAVRVSGQLPARARCTRRSDRYGLLIYTGSPDAEGTLGGLVQQARRIDEHLTRALEAGGLCSNDPTCAEHAPGDSMSDRFLHGAACHACALVAETSCEMRNDHLDRALVVPVLGMPDAAFFRPAG